MRRCVVEVIRKLVVELLRVYQLILSPLIGNQCRFYPSCSQYAIGCFESFGLIKAGALVICRLLRCHPFTRGGIDPIPDKMIG